MAKKSRGRSYPRPFNSTNLDKDFFRYLGYYGKKQIESGLAWHW